ncbi:MAG TPA: nicotinate-nucleotide adenylyltransferase [Methylomirabilota bacterium]
MTRTAIFGGSFNPIHYGHLLLADDLLERLSFDRLLFVPAGVPPHKPTTTLAPAADRYAMVKLAVADHPHFEVSDLELRRSGPSYTVDTLGALASADQALFLIVGSETFLDLLSWRAPRRIAELARLVVVPRAGSVFDPEAAAAQKVLREIGGTRFVACEQGPVPDDGVLVVHATSLPISASELRRRAREGRSLAYRLPPAVAQYIRSRRLYGGSPA